MNYSVVAAISNCGIIYVYQRLIHAETKEKAMAKYIRLVIDKGWCLSTEPLATSQEELCNFKED